MQRQKQLRVERHNYLDVSPERNTNEIKSAISPMGQRILNSNQVFASSQQSTSQQEAQKGSLADKLMPVIARYSVDSGDNTKQGIRSPPKHLQRQLTREVDPMSQSMREPEEPGTVTGFVQELVQGKEDYMSKTQKQKTLQMTKRALFEKNLTGKIIEDHNDGQGSGLLDKNAQYYFMDDGTLSQRFKDDLYKFKNEQVAMFEKSVETAKRSEVDIFGIKRRNCRVCLEDCAGYLTSSVMFTPSDEATGEFPTFCMNCSCPADFHEIESEQLKFPEDLSQVLTNYNIQSADLNFNCVLAAFLIDDPKSQMVCIAEISQILKEQGLEVISCNKRSITPDEAFYLHSRQIQEEEERIQKTLGTYFEKPQAGAEIRHTGKIDSLQMDEYSRKSPYMMESMAQMKEAFMRKQRDIVYEMQTGQKANPQKEVKVDPYVHDSANSLMKKSSLKNPSNPSIRKNVTIHDQENKSPNEQDFYKTFHQMSKKERNELLYEEMKHKECMQPHYEPKQFNISRRAQFNSQNNKAEIFEKRDETQETEFLFHAIATVPALSEMIENQMLFMVVSSSQFQNIAEKVRKAIADSHINAKKSAQGSYFGVENWDKQDLDSLGTNIPILSYLSSNKVKAFEDCIMFSPQLFRLQKSIVIAEPVIDFKTFLDLKKGGEREQKGSQQFGFEGTMGKGVGKRTQDYTDFVMGGTPKAEPLPSTQQSTTNPYRLNMPKHKRSHFSDSKLMPMQNKIGMRGTLGKMATRCFDRTLGQKTMTNLTAIKDENDQFEADKLNDLNLQGIENEDWVKAIHQKKLLKAQYSNKERVLTQTRTYIQYNYGVMRDFFNYSGMAVQYARMNGDLSQPIAPGGIRGNKDFSDFSLMPTNPANMFMIAKVGMPNLILPNSLDVKITNFENYESYTQIMELYFPRDAKSQLTVIIMRPVMVKNGLNDLFVQILKANEFIIIKRDLRMLSKGECAHLFRQEGLKQENANMFYNLMMDGLSEIIVVSKVAAINDAKTIFSGAAPYGRRRVNQINENRTEVRANVDSVNALFEIAPFSSFSEFIDLEDFLVRNSKINKYKRLGEYTPSQVPGWKPKQSDKSKLSSTTTKQLYFLKLAEIRRELNILTRFFNITGYCSPTLAAAQVDVGVFAPQVARLEEVCLVLNPIYNQLYEAAFECLLRAGFVIVNHGFKQLDQETANNLFAGKYTCMGMGSDGSRLLSYLASKEVHIFHLTKIAADRELRALYKQSDIAFEDLVLTTPFTPPIKVSSIPNIFFFMDTEGTFENGLAMIYESKYLKYTGSDIMPLSNPEKFRILQACLLVTVGDTVKLLTVDKEGNIVQKSKELLEAKNRDNFVPLNSEYALKQLGGAVGQNEPQFMPKQHFAPDSNQAVHFAVETDQHGLYEVRLHRLAHQNDSNVYDLVSETGEICAWSDAKRLFEQFSCQELYYSQVCEISGTICPSYYRWKIHPLQSLTDPKVEGECPNCRKKLQSLGQLIFQCPKCDKLRNGEVFACQPCRIEICSECKNARDMFHAKETLNRVYEVEEFMGETLLEGIATMQNEYVQRVDKSETMLAMKQSVYRHTGIENEKQKSLPAYVFGYKLAQMCKVLEGVRCHKNGIIKGAGRIIHDKESKKLRGEIPRITQSNYFEIDKQRYLGYLDNFKKGWHWYLSNLETDIIEEKIRLVINSLTFKYSRQPQYLTVMPDRLTSENLRISEKIHLLSKGATQDQTSKKFYESAKENGTDPDRENKVHKVVDSVMHTLTQARLHTLLTQSVSKTLKEDGITLDQFFQNKKAEKAKNLDRPYSIQQECAITGFQSLARRPKYQLVANILWIIDFQMRQVTRKPEMFAGMRAATKENSEVINKEYDQILDILTESIGKNYGNEEINAALDIVELKRGYETQFEKHMRFISDREKKSLARIAQQNSFKDIKERNHPGMHLDTLLTKYVYQTAVRNREKEREDLRRQLDVNEMQDPDSQAFTEELEKSKIAFGPYALKLAEEYVLRQRYKWLSKHEQKLSSHEPEKISYMKMEYFLFGVTEADRAVQLLKSMEKTMERLHLKEEDLQEKVQIKSQQLQNTDLWQTTHRIAKKSQFDALVKELELTRVRIESMGNRIQSKECELTAIFRELMAYDYYVPDVFFDRQMQIQRQEKKKMDDVYAIPLNVFWQEVETGEWVEPDVMSDQWPKHIAQYQTLTKLNYGQYLSVSLQKKTTDEELEKVKQLRRGVMAPNLRKVEIEEKSNLMMFDKFRSDNEIKQNELLEQNKSLLLEKGMKRQYVPDVPFLTDEEVRLQELAEQKIELARAGENQQNKVYQHNTHHR